MIQQQYAKIKEVFEEVSSDRALAILKQQVSKLVEQGLTQLQLVMRYNLLEEGSPLSHVWVYPHDKAPEVACKFDITRSPRSLSVRHTVPAHIEWLWEDRDKIYPTSPPLYRATAHIYNDAPEPGIVQSDMKIMSDAWNSGNDNWVHIPKGAFVDVVRTNYPRFLNGVWCSKFEYRQGDRVIGRHGFD